ncbi:MAG: sigma-54-dependent Fis family transcriptional regulator [Firmicutes bacterium]|nr:sigma-54-dependent Fis family transcriptional regulator [Bacillota bacterium]
MKKNILIVDDEKSICTFLALALEDEYEVYTADSPEQAYELLEKEKISLVILDLMLGEASGMDVLREIKEKDADIAVIMMTAYGDIKTSVEAIKQGAFHYLSKPVDIDELQHYIRQALEMQHLSRRVESLSAALEELEQRTYYGDIVGKSEPMQKIYQLIEKVKDIDTSVIITGERGTGKELVARAIHHDGARRNENFVSINCAAIPEGLLEEEFFGHAKGTFTGAIADKKGKLELADHGTLFLDEIGDMPLALQGKLLRVLQEKEMMPVGGVEYKKIDVRVICATNRNLMAMVQEGTFRQDLYYRLHVVNIHVPPLKERKQDIPDLCETILARLGKEMKRPAATLTPEAERFLLEYNYPGNVRELINILEYACIVCTDGKIDIKDFPGEMLGNQRLNAAMAGGMPIEGSIVLEELTPAEAVNRYLSGMAIKDVERLLIENALMKNPQSKRAAAKELGISDRSLFYKIQEYGL